MGLTAEEVGDIGDAVGQGDVHPELGNPDWAVDIQLAMLFKCPPHTFQQYQPSEILLMEQYFLGYHEGQEIKNRQNK